MISSKVFTILALMAASVSGMSIGHPSNVLAHRRHASEVTHNAVLQARAARQRDMSGFAKQFAEEEAAKRDVPRRVRKRGTNARRCAAKSSSSLLPSPTPAPVANVGGDPTESSTVPEPTSTSVKTSAPETTHVQPTKASATKTASKTSSSVKPTETSSDDGGSSSGGTSTGEGTFYGTGLGACGITNTDTDFICAVSHSLFDGFEGYTGGDPNKNPICGKKIKATYKGKSVTVTVTDRCVGCAVNDLDFSPSAFDKLAAESIGRLTGVTWSWA